MQIEAFFADETSGHEPGEPGEILPLLIIQLQMFADTIGDELGFFLGRHAPVPVFTKGIYRAGAG